MMYFNRRNPGGDGGGGGSSFIYLTEVDHGGGLVDLVADYRHIRVQRSELVFAGISDYGPGYEFVYLHPGVIDPDNSVYELWEDEGSGNYPLFQWNEDGSLHWGDAIVAPDISLGRNAFSGALDLNGHLWVYANSGAALVTAWPGDDYGRIELYAEDSSIWAGTGVAPTDTDWTRVAAGVWGISADGGGIRFKSPDGTPHTLKVGNDHVLTVDY